MKNTISNISLAIAIVFATIIYVLYDNKISPIRYTPMPNGTFGLDTWTGDVHGFGSGGRAQVFKKPIN
jgi:hypothetical protein